MTNTEFYTNLLEQYDLDIIEKELEIEHFEFMIEKLKLDIGMIRAAKLAVEQELGGI